MKPEQLIDLVCKALELDVTKVTTKQSGNGQSKYCDARHIIAYIIRQEHGQAYHGQGYSYKAIALMFGNTLASSALYNEWMCKEKLIFDKVFKAKFDKVNSCIRAVENVKLS